MNLLSYVSSWVYTPTPDVYKVKFTENVVPEIEKYETNKRFKKLVQQVKNTSTRQKSIEIMEGVKTELLSVPKKTYVVIETDRNLFGKITTPRISSKMVFKDLRYYNKFGVNQKQFLVKKPWRSINQPKPTNKFKQI